MTPTELIRKERSELLGFLRTLSPAEWEAPSLCDGWQVRDVVAHIATDSIPAKKYLAASIRHPSPSRLNQHFVGLRRSLTPDHLIELLESTAENSWFTRIAPGVALADHTVHHQDIRRPLGRPRSIDPDTLRYVLSHPDPFASSRRYTKGLRWQATDLDWSHGDGPVVQGPAESLMLAMVGRSVVLDDLTGDGTPTLRSRMTSQGR